MKKFDFSKEFGNIDPKYIEEAEREWSEKKENRRPKGWSKAAAACVIVTLGSVIFSNPGCNKKYYIVHRRNPWFPKRH